MTTNPWFWNMAESNHSSASSGAGGRFSLQPPTRLNVGDFAPFHKDRDCPRPRPQGTNNHNHLLMDNCSEHSASSCSRAQQPSAGACFPGHTGGDWGTEMTRPVRARCDPQSIAPSLPAPRLRPQAFTPAWASLPTPGTLPCPAGLPPAEEQCRSPASGHRSRFQRCAGC